MIGRGFGKDSKVISRGFGGTLANLWREIVNFRLILSSKK